MENILIIMGIILVLAGLAIKFLNKKELRPAKVIEQKPVSSSRENFDENKTKWDEFEKYVVLKFDTGYFTIKEWRSDKMVSGMYAVSNHFPDLEVEFNFNKKNIKETFAVECKYRSGYYQNSIEWAQGYQLANYQKYAAAIKIPVYIVIGVGGQPRNPAEIYIVPLEDAKSTVLTKDFLSPYKMEFAEKRFYWDTERNMLR